MILSYHCLLFSNLYQYLNLFMYIINHKFKESLGYIANFNTAVSQDHVSKHKSVHTQKIVMHLIYFIITILTVKSIQFIGV